MSPVARDDEITTVLWDLDDTLVRLHRRTFSALMPMLAYAAFADVVAPRLLPSTVGAVVARLRDNHTACSNHELLCALIGERTGCSPELVGSRLHWLAGSGFPLLRWCFRRRRGAPELVAALAARGLRQVVATNPLWPRQTVLRRLAWGGIDASHFDFITSGENMSTAKPSLAYYEQVLDRIGATPQQCAMVGNDIHNDLPAHRLGIAVYLIQPRLRPSPRHVGQHRVTTGPWSALPAWLGV
jgi:FMN phosphatase YigB (HAD superfamily)